MFGLIVRAGGLGKLCVGLSALGLNGSAYLGLRPRPVCCRAFGPIGVAPVEAIGVALVEVIGVAPVEAIGVA
jgi:hypothetical protein